MSFLSPGYFKDFLFVFGVQHFDYDIPSPLFLYIYFPSDISTSWMCGLTSFVSFGKFPGIFKSLQYFNIQYFTSLQILLCPILPKMMSELPCGPGCDVSGVWAKAIWECFWFPEPRERSLFIIWVKIFILFSYDYWMSFY